MQKILREQAIESQNLCPTCGKDAYAEFKASGKPHLCPDIKLNEEGQVI